MMVDKERKMEGYIIIIIIRCVFRFYIFLKFSTINFTNKNSGMVGKSGNAYRSTILHN